MKPTWDEVLGVAMFVVLVPISITVFVALAKIFYWVAWVWKL